MTEVDKSDATAIKLLPEAHVEFPRIGKVKIIGQNKLSR